MRQNAGGAGRPAIFSDPDHGNSPENKFGKCKIDKKARRRDVLAPKKCAKKSCLEMAEPGDDPIASWQERVGTLRKRGRVGAAALTVVPAAELDVRAGRPLAPERLSDEERELWEKLTFSRRPGWFSGAESLLESFVTTTLHCQHLEAALRKTKPGTSERYLKLVRVHRQSVALASTLATRLRLTPHSKLHKSQPTDGELPVG
jgi:hypothetical protein